MAEWGKGVGTDRAGRLLPLLEQGLGDFALQLIGGLLPGHLRAVPHVESVFARAMAVLRGLGVGCGGRQQQCAEEQEVPQRGLMPVSVLRPSRCRQWVVRRELAMGVS